MRQIVLDTETTGLDPESGHKIVELAGVEIINRQLSDNNIHIYLNPGRDSDPEALRIHGLTTEFLADKPRFKDVASQLAEFVQGAEVIIHNAAFDVKFLNAELKQCGMPSFNDMCDKITDSLKLAREMFPGRRNNLDALCERFGISNAHRTLHGALLDSELLGEVWLAMTRGQDSLLDEFINEDAITQKSSQNQIRDTSALRVIKVSPTDLEAHNAYLDTLDKAHGQPCLWREIENE